MTPPQEVSLRDVPVGTWVLHDGVGERRSDYSLLTGRGVLQLEPDTPVTLLVGTAPRLLTDADIGAWVWDPEPDHGVDDVVQILTIEHAEDEALWWGCTDGWSITLDWPVWIVQPAPEAPDEPLSEEARAEVDRVFKKMGWDQSVPEVEHAIPPRPSLETAMAWIMGNSDEDDQAYVFAKSWLDEYAPDGLQPQPERPTWLEVIDSIVTSAGGTADSHVVIESVPRMLAEHGYSPPVDLRDPEVAEAIEWLVGNHAGPYRSGKHTRTLLRVLGQEDE